MINKEERRRIAFLLYIENGYSKSQLAKKMGLCPATITSYIKQDRLKGLDWELEREQYIKYGSRGKESLQTCMDLVLKQSAQALTELELAEDLPPQKKAKAITEVMACISKATKTAKLAEPSLQVETIINQVMTVITEVLLKAHPNLAEAWLEATHQIEESLQAKKLNWE